MREIKFRGWAPKYDVWVKGNYAKTIIGNYEDEKHQILPFGETALSKEIDPITVCQYTGVKDYKGVEIYENDIVHYDGKPFNVYALKATGIIVNYKGSWALKYKSEYKTTEGYDVYNHYLFSSEDFFHAKSEVIGNIHEHPELLK